MINCHSERSEESRCPAEILRFTQNDTKVWGMIRVISHLTLESLDQIPGCSWGYGSLPEALRRQIVEDVPCWSAFIRQEAERFGYAYVDMVNDFAKRLAEAERVLTIGV